MNTKLVRIIKCRAGDNSSIEEVVATNLSKYAAKVMIERKRSNPLNKGYDFKIIPLYSEKEE